MHGAKPTQKHHKNGRTKHDIRRHYTNRTAGIWPAANLRASGNGGEKKKMNENDDLRASAEWLYSEPTIEESEE